MNEYLQYIIVGNIILVHAYTYICMLREHKYIFIIQFGKLMALPNSKYLKVIDIFSEILECNINKS